MPDQDAKGGDREPRWIAKAYLSYDFFGDLVEVDAEQGIVKIPHAAGRS